MRRRTIGLGLGLLLVGGVSVCFLARHGGGLRERTLEDGSIVTFRGVTYGTTHRMPGGPGWQRLLGRFLPARLASKFGLPVATYNNNTPLMMVWIEYRNPSGANRLAGQPVHYGSMWAPYALTDSAGTHFGSQAPATETKTPEGVLCGFWFGVLPRSSEQFRFRYSGYNQNGIATLLGSFTFPNPVFRGPSPRTPTSFPVTMQKDGLSFVLRGLSRRSVQTPTWSRAPAEVQMLAKVEVTDQTDTNRLWAIHTIHVLDPNGSQLTPPTTLRVVPSAFRNVDGGSDTSIAFAGGLSTNEAWTIRFELVPANVSLPSALAQTVVIDVAAQPIAE